MKIQDMLFTGVGVLLVSKTEVLVDNIKMEEERDTTTPTVAFDYGFLTQEKADTFPILICRNSHSVLHFISCGFHQRSWFSQNHFEMRK